MKEEDIETVANTDDIHDKFVYFVGPKNFQNDLISYFLYNKLGVRCISDNSIDCIQKTNNEKIYRNILILVDASSRGMNRLLIELEDEYNGLISHFLIALFNLNHNIGIENEVLRLGIRGFFYVDDTVNIFLKGIHIIFDGQLWVSRSILSECVLEDKNHSSHSITPISKNNKQNLTERELEIIAMITVGAKNAEIADKLYISPHTVKTHLYHVFKKINVSDRLQAALWAAKNLKQ